MRVADLFCGQGGAAKGYADAGFSVVGVDNDPAALARYPYSAYLGEWKDGLEYWLSRTEIDLIHASPPCFPAGTPVVTARGVVPIEAVTTTDMVLTHKGRWRPVTATMDRAAEVTTDGWLASTPDHPFLARERIAGRSFPFQLGKAFWCRADEMLGKFLAIPQTIEALDVPSVGGEYIACDASFWWMAGRWLGDGYVSTVERSSAPYREKAKPSSVQVPCLECGNPGRRSRQSHRLWTNYCSKTCCDRRGQRLRPAPRHRVYIVCAHEEADALQENLASVAGLTWQRETLSDEARFCVPHEGLDRWLTANFGSGAAGKTLPGWIFGLEVPLRQAFLDGYLSADGYEQRRIRHMINRPNTVSCCLAFGVRILATTLGYKTSISRSGPFPSRKGVLRKGKVRIISHQLPSWEVGISADDGVYTRSTGSHRWVKRRRVNGKPVALSVEKVFDLTVEEDHSFVAWGFVVHNCQRYSQAARLHPKVNYPDLIGPVRSALTGIGLPFIIENVPGAPLLEPVFLCGSQFGLGGWWKGRFVGLDRRRGFEASFPVVPSANCSCEPPTVPVWGNGCPSNRPYFKGPGFAALTREAMRISWMTREFLCEAIPPAYTEFLAYEFQCWKGEMINVRNRSAADRPGNIYDHAT